MFFRHFVDNARLPLAGFCLPGDHSVCLPDGTALIAGSFQTIIGYFRPKFF
jgi:hypothetical protein